MTSTTMNTTTNSSTTPQSSSTTMTTKTSTPGNTTTGTTSTLTTTSTTSNATSITSTLSTTGNQTATTNATTLSSTLTTSTNISSTLSTVSTVASNATCNSTITTNITTAFTTAANTTASSLTSIVTSLATTIETTSFDYDESAEACNLTDIVHTTRSVTVTFYTIIFILGLLGNFLVLMTIIWNRRISFTVEIYFVNLAISDLMFVCTLPFWIMYLLEHDVMSHASCVTMTAIFYCALFASTVFLLLIVLDRCYAILLGTEKANRRLLRNAVSGCMLMWGLCFILALPHFIFMKKGTNVCVAEYEPGLNNFYVIFINTEVNLCTLVLPAAAIIYWYLKLTKALKTHERLRHRLTSLNIVLAVVIVFALFWLPYNLMLMMYSLVHMQIPWECSSEKILRRSLIITESIALSHCCINPIIYLLFGPRCRSEFCHLLRCCFTRLCPHRSWSAIRAETVSISLSHSQVSASSEDDDNDVHDELQFLI
ncbi:Cy220 [Cynomolgus cytomegalovirus]|uniref:Protein US28e n=1 Tax=Cynomolgus macaque cytomegalovirus strain Mauritius TaxID=1690255 RepID=A0A0K1GZS4_9BETA|nr:Cy220 [Cynomolgus cytomegalovirus]AKT72676.1 protein US28e [Cynomolgus macaque cytomegalovirus strain Mauritius]AXG21955.1 protein US28e [synthetic construct]APT39276.1 Cy220 [Cynomolgus cytomegalovirus]APT39563.1 Cy220 [Cynomolgus cytomegalovirus]APT39660.1 Cy220 [Cynomolgus cytomegalovirus]